jgi:Ca2+-binding RTX toxin-like protein
MHSDSTVPNKMNSQLATRSRRRRPGQTRHRHAGRSLLLEPLEPRALLTALPWLVSVTRGDPLLERTNETNVVFHLQFSESVVNVDDGDFTTAGTLGWDAKIAGVKPEGGSDYYDVQVAVPKGSSGTLGLWLAKETDIVDKDGNPLDPKVQPDPNETYTIDTASPVVVLAGGEVSYCENAAATLVDATATVQDPDSPTFAGGSLTVQFLENGTSDDRLAIRHEGPAPGQIGVVGATVSYGGTAIGVFTGGSDGSTPLVVALNANATQPAVEALVRNITYENVSDAPSTLTRRVGVIVADGAGNFSPAASQSITVLAVNDAPVNTVPAGVQAVMGAGFVPLVFSPANGNGITTSDVEAAAEGLPIQVSLAVYYGTLQLFSTAGLTFISGADGTGAMTFRGSPATIQTALTFLIYTPDASYLGPDTLSVSTNDLGIRGGTPSDPSALVELTDTDMVSIWVMPAYRPAAFADYHAADEDSASQSLPVLANDWNVAGQYGGNDLVITAVTQGSQGGTVVNQGTSVSYSPAPDFVGTETFTYTVADVTFGGDGPSTATVFVIVNPVNDAPSFTAADPPRINEDAAPQTVAGWVQSFSAGPANEQMQTVLRYIVSDVSNPALFSAAPTVAANGTLTYTPAPGAFGTSDFTVAVQDDGGTARGGVDTSGPQTFTIVVDPAVILPGGRGTNQLVVARNGDNLQVVHNKKQVLFNEPLASFRRLTLIGPADKPNLITLDLAVGGNFQLPDGLIVLGAAGKKSDTLKIIGTPQPDTFAIGTDQVLANGLRVAFQGVEQVQVDGTAGDDTYAVLGLGTPVTVYDKQGVELLDFSQAPVGIALIDLNSSKAQQVFGAGSTLTLKTKIENLIGTPFDDQIRGNSLANVLWGRGGSDTVYGSSGNDSLFGEDGNDKLFGDSGNDLLVGGDGDDTLDGGAGNDRLFGDSGQDSLLGQAGNDLLVGGDDRDTLDSGAGKNVLIGGRGADSLTGGSGEDLLIASRTDHDANDQALSAIVTEWTARTSFATRIDNLTAGVGPAQAYKLRKDETIRDDGTPDTLRGGNGSDWFLAFDDDLIADRDAKDR